MALRQRSIDRDAGGVVESGEQHDELVTAAPADDVVLARVACVSTSATATSRASPASCPQVSFTALKRSRSIMATVKHSPDRRAWAARRTERVLDQAAVAEAGQRVGGGVCLRDGQVAQRGEHRGWPGGSSRGPAARPAAVRSRSARMITAPMRSPPDTIGRPAGEGSSGPVTSTIDSGRPRPRDGGRGWRGLRPPSGRSAGARRTRAGGCAHAALATLAAHEQHPVQCREEHGSTPTMSSESRDPRVVAPSRSCRSSAREQVVVRRADLGQLRARGGRAAASAVGATPLRQRRPASPPAPTCRRARARGRADRATCRRRTAARASVIACGQLARGVVAYVSSAAWSCTTV